MTTPDTAAKNPQPRRYFRLPDPPEREPDDMTSFDHLSASGSTHHLIQHFGNPNSTLVAGEHYLVVLPTRRLAGSRYPDLLIAFGVDPMAYKESNGYIIEEQGKPPDFVLEIASRRTGREDVIDKRRDYEGLGITEYWRFDETGQHHMTRLAGDQLVDARYQPVPIEEIEAGVLQGYSAVLDLYIRWEGGRLAWHDPATGRHILTYDDQRDRADSEREARIREQNRADSAQARVHELEEELKRLKG